MSSDKNCRIFLFFTQKEAKKAGAEEPSFVCQPATASLKINMEMVILHSHGSGANFTKITQTF